MPTVGLVEHQGSGSQLAGNRHPLSRVDRAGTERFVDARMGIEDSHSERWETERERPEHNVEVRYIIRRYSVAVHAHTYVLCMLHETVLRSVIL